MKNLLTILCILLSYSKIVAQVFAGYVTYEFTEFNPNIELINVTPGQEITGTMDVNDDGIQDLEFALYKGYTMIDGANTASVHVINSDITICNDQQVAQWYVYGEMVQCTGNLSWTEAPLYYLGNYGCFGCMGPATLNQNYIAYHDAATSISGWIRLSMELNDAGDLEAPITLIVDQAMIYATGPSHKWLSLPVNTTDNGVTVGNISIGETAITVEALINLHSSDPIPDAYDIVSKHASIFDCNYLLRPDAFAIRTSDGFISLDNPVVLCKDSVYHVAGSYDGDSIRYFVNGAQVASVHWTGTLYENSHITGIGNLTFSTDYNEQFTGDIDEVRIWDIARTQSEIDGNMYALANPVDVEGLVAYYKFDNDYLNLQGNSLYNGTPYGSDISLSENDYFYGQVTNDNCTPATVQELGNSAEIRVYPNPAQSELFVAFDGGGQSVELNLINILGKKILTKKFTSAPDAFLFMLDISELARGAYILRLTKEHNSFCQRIIKQ